MLAKRKFQNLVQTYGDQSISGKKTFTENLVVTGQCTLPDDTNLNINFGTSSILQSAIISTSGWIYDTFAQIVGSVNDLVSDINENAFGFLKTTDTISQNLIDETTQNGWISTNLNSKAPTVSPTFTGTISLNGDVTLAATSANTLTLKDHLVLVTGANFITPVSGQQGYIVTGTITANATSITSGTSIDFATINLSYGVWLIIGHLGYLTSASGTITDKYFWINSDAATHPPKNMIKNSFTVSVVGSKNMSDSVQRIVTVTSASQTWYLGGNISFTTFTLATQANNTNLYAVRIA